LTEQEIERAVKASLWRRGILDWKLREHQRPIYEHISRGGGPDREKPATKTVLNISRQTGKSFTAVLYAVEHCLKTKYAHVQFLAATGKQMRTILLPALKKILDDCPLDIAPIPSAADGTWTFPSTGAVLRFDGVDNDNAENLRGRSSTLVIFDEAGYITDLEYVVKDIVQPQFITTHGRMIIISTPPETPDHYFKTLCDQAMLEDAYLVRDVYLNGFATPEDIEQWMIECGGEASTTWQREYLCQFIVDSARSVFPEATEERMSKMVKTVPPAGHNNCVVGMDVGFKDATAVLFGYYDFRQAKLMIQRELFIRGKEVRTDTLANSIKMIESSIWGRPPAFRVSDIELILLNDLVSIHGLDFRPATKDYKEAQVNEVRLWIAAERIQIDPSCQRLIQQMKNAIWNKQRTIFERDADGHYDCVDALIYLVRTLPSVVPLNPYPKHAEGVHPATHWISDRRQEQDQDVAELSKLRQAYRSDEIHDEDFEEFEKLFA